MPDREPDVASIRGRLIEELERAEDDHRTADSPIDSHAGAANAELAREALALSDAELIHHLQREVAGLETKIESMVLCFARALAARRLAMIRRVVGHRV